MQDNFRCFTGLNVRAILKLKDGLTVITQVNVINVPGEDDGYLPARFFAQHPEISCEVMFELQCVKKNVARYTEVDVQEFPPDRIDYI